MYMYMCMYVYIYIYMYTLCDITNYTYNHDMNTVLRCNSRGRIRNLLGWPRLDWLKIC